MEPKNIVFDIGDVLFSYELAINNQLPGQAVVQSFTPIEAGLAILTRCHELKVHGFRLFVLSNFPTGPMEYLKECYPQVMALFEGIVGSDDAKAKKPHPTSYRYILETYQLDAADCIFIDDKAANIEAARAHGMIGIVCDDHDRVERELIKLGIFTHIG